MFKQQMGTQTEVCVPTIPPKSQKADETLNSLISHPSSHPPSVTSAYFSSDRLRHPCASCRHRDPFLHPCEA